MVLGRGRPTNAGAPDAIGKGRPMVSGRKPDLNRHRQVAELRNQGLSMAEIGRQLGISRQAVHATLRSMQSPNRRVVLCRKCKMPIDPTGVLPKEAKTTLCLICLSR